MCMQRWRRKGQKVMKPEVRIETDSKAEESPEVVIRCREITPEIHRLAQRLQAECDGIGQEILLTLCGRDYIVALDHILFFETSGEHTVAHTADGMYYTDQSLSRLVCQLPPAFFRGSKSCIVNTRQVASLHRELTGVCEVCFAGSTKRVYVSRMYYKAFRARLDEIRFEA